MFCTKFPTPPPPRGNPSGPRPAPHSSALRQSVPEWQSAGRSNSERACSSLISPISRRQQRNGRNGRHHEPWRRKPSPTPGDQIANSSSPAFSGSKSTAKCSPTLIPLCNNSNRSSAMIKSPFVTALKPGFVPVRYRRLILHLGKPGLFPSGVEARDQAGLLAGQSDSFIFATH